MQYYTNNKAVSLKIGLHKVYVIVFVSRDWNRCSYYVHVLKNKIACVFM